MIRALVTLIAFSTGAPSPSAGSLGVNGAFGDYGGCELFARGGIEAVIEGVVHLPDGSVDWDFVRAVRGSSLIGAPPAALLVNEGLFYTAIPCMAISREGDRVKLSCKRSEATPSDIVEGTISETGDGVELTIDGDYTERLPRCETYAD